MTGLEVLASVYLHLHPPVVRQLTWRSWWAYRDQILLIHQAREE